MNHPRLMHTVLDAVDPQALADFYRELLGLSVRSGDAGDWIVLLDASGQRVLAFQRVETLAHSTWPSPEVPQQLHLDFRVDDVEQLELHRGRAEELGARLLLDRSADTEEPLYVLADPEGHPFCVMVSPG